MTDTRRLLILDYALATPEINEGVAVPYLQSGWEVEYRPYFPNLTRTDPDDYQAIALLAGRTPAFPSGLMSEHEVPLAVEFVRNGGLLILGPNLDGGEGANERCLFNRILGNLGVAIRICNDQVTDDIHQYTATLFDRALYRTTPDHPVCLGVKPVLAMERSTSLLAGPDISVPLTTFETARPRGAMPVIALARPGKGLVLVAGRYLLNATGIPLRISGEPVVHPDQLEDTALFLQNLAARVTSLRFGTTEWDSVNPLTPDVVGAVSPPDFDTDRTRVLDRVPAGTSVHRYTAPSSSDSTTDSYSRTLADHYAALPDERLYGWIRDEGVRACWGSTVDWGGTIRSQADVIRVAETLKAMDVNLFWGISNCQAVGGPGYSPAERAQVVELWRWTADALDGSNVKWYPTLDYRYFRQEKTRCYGAQGQKLDAVSPMDTAFWMDNWRNSLLAVAEFSLDHPCVGGITMDVELYGHPPAYNYYTGYGFEDECYFTAIDRWSGWIDDGLLKAASEIQLPGRFTFLKENGLLEAYFSLLSDEIARICQHIRDAVWRVNPNLVFASYIFTTPSNWFELGLYRGFSSPERPLILMTFNVRSGRMMEQLRRRGIYAYHTSVALLGMIHSEDYETVFVNSRRYGHGYWMNNVNALLIGDAHSVEAPARKGVGSEDAIRAIYAANQKMKQAQR